MWSAGIDNHFVGNPSTVQFPVEFSYHVLGNDLVISTKEAERRVPDVLSFFKQGGIGSSKLPGHPRVEANHSGKIKVLFCAGQKRESPAHTKAKGKGRTSSAFSGT